MSTYETSTHPFIIKIWIEEMSHETSPGQKEWRGHITHVPSGEKRYLKSMDDIRQFIAPYLAAEGVDFS